MTDYSFELFDNDTDSVADAVKKGMHAAAEVLNAPYCPSWRTNATPTSEQTEQRPEIQPGHTEDPR